MAVRVLHPKTPLVPKVVKVKKAPGAPKVKNTDSDLKKLLTKLRSKVAKAPTMEDMTQEVESVRMKRYAKK